MNTILKPTLIAAGVIFTTCETVGTGVLVMNVTGNRALSSGAFFPLLFLLGIAVGSSLAWYLLRRAGENVPLKAFVLGAVLGTPLALVASALFSMTFSFGPKEVCVGAYVIQMLLFLSSVIYLLHLTHRMSQPPPPIVLDPTWFQASFVETTQDSGGKS